MKAMCKFFGLSRAAYYAWVKRLDQPDPDQDQMELVQEAYRKSRRTYGYRRITLWLRKNKGIFINHKAVLRLMDKLNIHDTAGLPRHAIATGCNAPWRRLAGIASRAAARD